MIKQAKHTTTYTDSKDSKVSVSVNTFDKYAPEVNGYAEYIGRDYSIVIVSLKGGLEKLTLSAKEFIELLTCMKAAEWDVFEAKDNDDNE